MFSFFYFEINLYNVNWIRTPIQKKFSGLYLNDKVTFFRDITPDKMSELRKQQLTPLLIQGMQSICHWHSWVSSAYSAYLNGVRSHFLSLCGRIYHYLPNTAQCHTGMERPRENVLITFFMLQKKNVFYVSPLPNNVDDNDLWSPCLFSFYSRHL